MKAKNIEIEVKFVIADPSQHEAIWKLPALGSFRVIHRAREAQDNAYWDSTDLALRKARAILRVRTVGRRRELTFKRSLGRGPSIHRRQEINAPLTANAYHSLNSGTLSNEALRAADKILKGHRPAPLFSLITVRRKALLAYGKNQVELAVDHVRFLKGRRVTAHRLEVELENVSATPAQFRQALKSLRVALGGRANPSNIAKYEFGFRVFKRH